MFTDKYKLQLPDPKILEAELEHEKRRLVEASATISGTGEPTGKGTVKFGTAS